MGHRGIATAWGLAALCCALTAAQADTSRWLDALAADPAAQARTARLLDLVRPGPPNGQPPADTRFQPVPGGLDTPALLARSYPASARGEAQRLFEQLLAVYPQVEQRHGIPPHDLAGAVATFIAGAYTGYSGQEVEDQDLRAVVQQMRRALGRKPGLAAVPAREKQAAYEQLVVLALLTLATHEALAQQPDVPGAEAIRARLRAASKGYLESLLGLDADRIRVNQEGVTLGVVGMTTFAAEPGSAGAGARATSQPALVATGSTARAGAIEAVVLVKGYAMTGVGGALVLKFRPAVLYGDGTYTKDPARALSGDARIDGRWRRSSGGWTLIDAKGKATEVKAEMRALPAAPGALLQGSYRSLSGVGAASSGVGVVAAWAEMRFDRDGTVQLGQGAGAKAGDTAAASGRSRTARYVLDGHAISLTWPDGRREQRLFYFLPGNNGERAIGLGSATLSPRR